MTKRGWTRLALGLGLAVTVAVGAATLRGQGHQGEPTASPSEDLASARGDLAAMVRGEARVVALLKAAQRGKDIIKTDCVHEKLTHIKSIVSLAREQITKYVADRSAGIDTGAVPIRQKMSIFKERTDEKVAEAERCAGETVAVTDKANVQEEVDPELPQWDPTQPAGSYWVMPRPPESSPYL